MRKSGIRANYYPKLWEAMKKVSSFTTVELIKEAGLEPERWLIRRISLYLKSLAAKGHLKQTQQTNSGASRYRYELISQDLPFEDVPLIHRCWHYVWNRKVFSSRDLVSYANVSAAVANRFCTTLKRIGYVRVEEACHPRQGFSTLRLVADSGPLPLIFRGDGSVFDPNRNQTIHPIQGVEDDEKTDN